MTSRYRWSFLLLLLAATFLAILLLVVILLRCDLPGLDPCPRPSPSLELELSPNHDGSYVPGTWVGAELLSSDDGYVDVYTIDASGGSRRVFEVEVKAGQPISRDWRVPDAEGEWQLEARLNQGQALARQDFTVRWDLEGPRIDEVEFEPPVDARPPLTVTAGPLCPGDTTAAYVRVLDGSDLVRVELRTRYPPGFGDWEPERMQPIEGGYYHSSMPVHDELGTEYYVYAEDAIGNWSESPPEVYLSESCFELLFDFVAEAPAASWTFFYPNPYTATYTVTNEFDEGYPMGGAHLRNAVAMEDTNSQAQVLEAFPPQVSGGEIWGRYKMGDLVVEPGDQFVARVGLEAGAGWGDTFFGVRFQSGDPDSPVTTKVTFPGHGEGDDPGGVKTWTVPLPGGLTGRYFDLVVDAGARAFQDRAVWVEAQLQRPLR